MDKIIFHAHLWKVSKDHDGEVTLTLKVPQSDQVNAINLPENEIFLVTIESGNDPSESLANA